MSRSATSSINTQEPKVKNLKTSINEWFRILACHQIDIANEQKNNYNRLRRWDNFCVTKLKKLGDAHYESESKEEEEEEEMNE